MTAIKKVKTLGIGLFLGAMIFQSCEKVTYEKQEFTGTVKFSADIQPIFDNNCVSCHSGSLAPNLSDGKSFSSLVPGYVNLTTPADSKLYKQLTTNSSHIPRTTDLEKQKILKWIEQGAKND